MKGTKKVLITKTKVWLGSGEREKLKTEELNPLNGQKQENKAEELRGNMQGNR